MISEDNITQCPNCRSEVTGNYCSYCGQRNQRLRQPVGHFVRDAFHEYFGIDGSMWRSLAFLFIPGRLTLEYVAGRRTRLLRPLRIYLLSTLLFFFLIAIIDPASNIQSSASADNAPDTTATVESRLATIDVRLEYDVARLAKQVYLVDSLSVSFDELSESFRIDSLAGSIPDTANTRRDEVNDARKAWKKQEQVLIGLRKLVDLRRQRFIWQQAFLSTLPPDSVITPTTYHEAAVKVYPEENTSSTIDMPEWLPRSPALERLETAVTNQEQMDALGMFIRGAIDKLPITIFLMLPVFALLLKVIFVRRDWYYTEHLVFGLHTHAFTFLMLSVMALLVALSDGAKWTNIVQAILAIVTLFYFFVAMKSVYKQGAMKTFAKFIVLGMAYNFVLIVGALIALILAAIF